MKSRLVIIFFSNRNKKHKGLEPVQRIFFKRFLFNTILKIIFHFRFRPDKFRLKFRFPDFRFIFPETRLRFRLKEDICKLYPPWHVLKCGKKPSKEPSTIISAVMLSS